MPVPQRVYSAYREGVLAAVIRSGAGSFRRAGYKGKDVLDEIAFADCELFSAKEEQLIHGVLKKSKGLDDFLFRIKLEGLELRDGEPKYDLPYRRW